MTAKVTSTSREKLTKKKTGRQEQDSPWKTIVGLLFELFIAFYFPLLYRTIDWTRDYEQLDTELARIKRNSATGKRVVDKLVKVYLLDGQEAWILIHVEIQGYNDKTFAERMFTYNYLLRHRFKKPIESLAILTDSNSKFRPDSYQEKLTVTETNFKFGMVKLMDYRSHWAELEKDSNPFALVTMAHLKAMELKGAAKDEQRLGWKVQLAKLLDERKLSQEIAAAIFDFIDWIIVLPEDLEEVFQQKLGKEKVLMPYVNSIERLATRRGLERGRQEGMYVLIEELLEERFGKLEPQLQQQLAQLSVPQLQKLGKQLLSLSSKEELLTWLNQPPPAPSSEL